MEPDFPTTTRYHPFNKIATPFGVKGVAILQITSLVLGKCIIYSEQTDHAFALNK